MYILGIETSCDETSVAILSDDGDVRAHLVLSQLEEHEQYGGVVPEIAARAHLDYLNTMIEQALQKAEMDISEIGAVAATCGPGLIGGVMVGMMTGKAIAAARNIPFIPVNHLEAHILSPRLTDDIPFPYLVLLVSGGHTQILLVKAVGDYELWATTRDDAAGECFDKAAKLMGLPYPGGPNLEKCANDCKNAQAALTRFPFSIPMEHDATLDFSFSGLKTAIRTQVQKLTHNSEIKQDDLTELAFSFQATIAATLAHRLQKTMRKFKSLYPAQKSHFVVCGGVAANKTIRAALEKTSDAQSFAFLAPPLEYCTDNAAMVAWAGIELFKIGHKGDLSARARPRWPLQELKETA